LCWFAEDRKKQERAAVFYSALLKDLLFILWKGSAFEASPYVLYGVSQEQAPLSCHISGIP